jgi:hypothetical protein
MKISVCQKFVNKLFARTACGGIRLTTCFGTPIDMHAVIPVWLERLVSFSR